MEHVMFGPYADPGMNPDVLFSAIAAAMN